MGGTLYDTDILTWSEQQADLLRRLAAGERVNADVDWTNLIDEVETVGRSELRRVENLAVQAIRHLIKLYLNPGSEAGNLWRREVRNFLTQARRNYSPSMRQRINMSEVYADARGVDEEDIPPAAIAQNCPFTIHDLLHQPSDIEKLVNALEPHSDA